MGVALILGENKKNIKCGRDLKFHSSQNLIVGGVLYAFKLIKNSSEVDEKPKN